MKTSLNKVLPFAAVMTTLLLATVLTFTSCGDGKGNSAIINHIKPVDEALLGVVDSYSAGLISEGEPLKISFNQSANLTKAYGEPLPSNLFKIEPSLKGKPYWIDEHTIGFEYSGEKCGKQYKATVDLSQIINYDGILEFGFGFRSQDFTMEKIEPIYSSAETADFDVTIRFANPINEEEAMKLIDGDFAKNHSVRAHAIDGKTYTYHISGMTRNGERYEENVNMNGSKIGATDKIVRLFVAPKDLFAVDNFYHDKKHNSVSVYFTQPLSPNQNLAGYLAVEPESTTYKTEINNNKLVIYYEPHSNDDYGYYHDSKELAVSVFNGIKDSKGKSLASGESRTFSLTDNKPEVRWKDNGVIIPSLKDTEIYFDAICLNSVTVRIIRVYDNNILSFVQQNDLDDTWGIQRVGRLERKIHLAIDNPNPNNWKTFPIRLSDYVNVTPGSMYQIEIDFGPEDYTFATDEAKKLHKDIFNEDDYWDNNSYDYKTYYYDGDWDDPNGLTYYNSVSIMRNVFVSDVALTVKMGDNNTFDAFAFSISEAKPISGANITAYNYQMQEIANGKTNSEGHISMTCPNSPYFVVATDKSKGKAVVVTKNHKSLSYSKFNIGGESVEKGVKGFIYSNRGIWRPGDELQLNLMLSGVNDIPEDYPVVLEVFDASGQKYANMVCNNHKGGIYSFNVPTSPNDATGQWRASFKVGNATLTKYLRVETVKPNRLEITFDLPKCISTTNNSGTELNTKWLNGMTATGLKATIDAKLTQGITEFVDFKDYEFVNESDNFYPEEIEIFSDKMDNNGSANVSFGPLDELQSSSMLDAAFTVKVFEAGGDFSVATFFSKVSSYSRYVGVKLPETQSRWGSYYFTNHDYKFDVAVVNENGKAATGTSTLEYSLYKLDSYWWWSSEDSYTLQRYVTGTYKNPERQATLMCNNGKANININIPADKWGNYLLVVRDSNGGNTFAKVICFDDEKGNIHSTGSSEAPTLLMLRTSAESYKVGETITASFPANKKSRAIVTVETADRVLQHIYLDNLDNDAKVEIKATQEMIPNVYIYVSLIQPHDANNGMPVRMYGVVPVKVEDREMLLNPVITAPDMANTKKTIQVKVKEEKGRPMTYTLAVVDEGILGLTNFKTPAPYDYFNSKQALGVRTWDNYSNIADAFTGELGSVYAIGGDGMVNIDQVIDNRFKAFAATYGPFELKKNGSNTHDIEIPKSSGALRVMVVAKGNEKSYGSNAKRITVQDPIMLYASAPRVVGPGDVAVMNVEVLAPKLTGKTLNVKIEANNLEPKSSWPTTVKIDNKGSGLLTIPATVKNVNGIATMKVSVTGDGYTVESATDMPIRLPNTEKRVNYSAEADGGKTATVNFDMSCIEGSQTARIMMSPAIPVDIYSRLDYLTSYPHGCLEQIVSAAFPQLYINYFITQDEESIAKTKENVNSTIASIKSYLKPDYSLSVWPGSNCVDPWVEIYTMHFLAEARNQGFEVPDHIFNSIVKHQASTANAWNVNPDFPQGEVIQAYRLFALTVANNAEKSAMNRFKDIKMIHPLTKILAAAAFAQTGKATVAEKLLQNTGEEVEENNYYMAPYSSSVRDQAIILYANMMMNGKDVKEEMLSLCDEINSNRWLSTQTTSFALFTLGKYAEKKSVSNAPISAVVVVNGEEHNINANTVSAGFAFTPKNGKNTIEIRNNAGEKLMARIFTKAAVMEYATKEDGKNLTMKVKYVDKNGKVINPSSLEAGSDFSVMINVSNTTSHYLDNLALSYYLPSGWEIVNDRINGGANNHYADIRDDRAYYYFGLYSGENKTFQLKLNSTFVGTFVIPAVTCEDMYDDQTYYIVPSQKATVKQVRL